MGATIGFNVLIFTILYVINGIIYWLVVKQCKKSISKVQSLETKKFEQLAELDGQLERTKAEIIDKEHELQNYSDLQEKMRQDSVELQETLVAQFHEQEVLLQRDIDNLVNIRKAMTEANVREEQMQADLNKYRVFPSESDLEDIKELMKMRKMLNKPRILSMLIWQSYFQKPLKSMSNLLLGSSLSCGIYRITNILDGKCYIGQSVDIHKRWATHMKAGLGIDTPVNNKLYQAMERDGVWNFTFELLEKCNREQLNEREKFYIEVYDTYNYGYNSTKGNN